MGIFVREAMPHDFPEAIDVIKKAHRISFAHMYPRELIESFCTKYTPETMFERSKHTLFFIAEDSQTKKIVGVIGLERNKLRTFFVDPDFQGKGVGKLLYQHLEDKARKIHIQKLILEGSPLGEPIYAHFGFKKLRVIEKERSGIRYTDAYMEKLLS